jgi:hypothetical protein
MSAWFIVPRHCAASMSGPYHIDHLSGAGECILS